MSDSRPFSALDAFLAAPRSAEALAALDGASLRERDGVAAAASAAFEQALAEARLEAAATGRPVAVDGSAFGMVASGDIWTCFPDGRCDRRLTALPGFEAFLGSLSASERPFLNAQPPEESIFRVCYVAHWCPTATNGQPARVVRLGPEAAARALGRPAEGAALMLLRRDRYESLLGDTLGPFGLDVTAREESIDAGIHARTLTLAAAGLGLGAREAPVPPERAAAWAALAAEAIEARAPNGPRGEAWEAVRAGLAAGRFLPDAIVELGGGEAPRYDFEALAYARSTQRVASPTRPLPPEAFGALWRAALAARPEARRPLFDVACFEAEAPATRRIGEAMFTALYGAGADPDTRAGGTGGLLTAVSAERWLKGLAAREPEVVSGWLEAAGVPAEALLDPEALAKAARRIPVRAGDLGPDLRARLGAGGKYAAGPDGLLVDAGGKPMSLAMLLRLVRALGSTFGNYFLKFQATHPANAVVCVDPAAGHAAFRELGALAADLSYLARAAGYSAIVKTGPIDLAKEAIAEVVASERAGTPLAEALREGRMVPGFTFQVGWPLGPDERVEAGSPDERSGLAERRRDKRPPRADFGTRFLP